MSQVRVALVGATGAVGRQMLQLLEDRDFPVDELVCLADPREEGTTVDFRVKTYSQRSQSGSL